MTSKQKKKENPIAKEPEQKKEENPIAKEPEQKKEETWYHNPYYILGIVAIVCSAVFSFGYGVSDINSKIHHHSVNIDTHDKEIKSLKNDVVKLEANIEFCNKGITELNNSVTGIRTDFMKMQIDMTIKLDKTIQLKESN